MCKFDLFEYILIEKKLSVIDTISNLNLKYIFFTSVVQYKQDTFKCRQFNFLTGGIQSQSNQRELHLLSAWTKIGTILHTAYKHKKHF